MDIPGRFRRSDDREADDKLKAIQQKFGYFLSLLDKNNQVLKVISDMEESSHGRHVFDTHYIAENTATIRNNVRDIINNMVAIGGDKYRELYDAYRRIDEQVQHFLPGSVAVRQDHFTVDIHHLRRERAWSVGSKNAQLGEMKTRLGLPVPDGFAISAWAYKHFVDTNNLQAKIDKLMERIDLESHEDLSRKSAEIRELITSSPVPNDLAEAIRESCKELKRRTRVDRFSLRSSAIGEDTLLSFAGQYMTFLNVRCREMVDRYRDVLASKFTPKAIFYLLSHSLHESDLAMSVGCVAMVDAAASGVAYSRDPMDPDSGNVVVNSIYGLGRHLVDGTLTPDKFLVSRKDGSIQELEIADKPICLVVREEGGTVDEPVPPNERKQPSISMAALKLLIEYAIVLEEHYGSPQDIEWAVDRRGKLNILQTRPLRVMKASDVKFTPDEQTSRDAICYGTTVCPGAGIGKIHRAISPQDLNNMPDNAVLVAPRPFPGLITILEKASAIVVQVGGMVSHLATLAREYHTPTIVATDCMEKLTADSIVTVDATDGVIYRGEHKDVVNARTSTEEKTERDEMSLLLEKILERISPLNLLNPADSSFTPQYCQTFHDITRFAHQSAITEMFSAAESLIGRRQLGLKLKSELPIDMHIIFIDENYKKFKGKKAINEKDIASEPMRAFWDGVKQEGWPSDRHPKMFGTRLGTAAESNKENRDTEFSESSFAILGKEYMISGLHMGYHFSTVEAMITDDVSKNFIRMQYKEGGAALDRRIRRVNLLSNILSEIGFAIGSKGDFFQASISYLSRESARNHLQVLGRLSILTKQLDMALHNDELAKWYTEYFKKKLGMTKTDYEDF